MNMLTTRKLPMWHNLSDNNLKYRIDTALVGMIVAAVQMKNPRLRCGKRFSIEYALTQWLHSEGLLREGVNIPELAGGSNGNNE